MTSNLYMALAVYNVAATAAVTLLLWAISLFYERTFGRRTGSPVFLASALFFLTGIIGLIRPDIEAFRVTMAATTLIGGALAAGAGINLYRVMSGKVG